MRARGLSEVERDPPRPSGTPASLELVSSSSIATRGADAARSGDQDCDLESALAYPTIAVYAKIDALVGLKQYHPALALANSSLARLQGTLYEQHKSQVYISRGSINRERGDWNDAISDYKKAISISQTTENYRGITDAGGLLAQAYEHTCELPAALSAINAAIEANTHMPTSFILFRETRDQSRHHRGDGPCRGSRPLYRKSVALVMK